MNDEYINLIIKAAYDIAHYQKEIIALRYVLSDIYPYLKDELVSDLTSYLELDKLYLKITEITGYNPLENDEYEKDIKELINKGYTDKYPFSI